MTAWNVGQVAALVVAGTVLVVVTIRLFEELYEDWQRERAMKAMMAVGRVGRSGYSKCPVCGYWAFNGEECFDCGYRPRGAVVVPSLLDDLPPSRQEARVEEVDGDGAGTLRKSATSSHPPEPPDLYPYDRTVDALHARQPYDPPELGGGRLPDWPPPSRCPECGSFGYCEGWCGLGRLDR